MFLSRFSPERCRLGAVNRASHPPFACTGNSSVNVAFCRRELNLPSTRRAILRLFPIPGARLALDFTSHDLDQIMDLLYLQPYFAQLGGKRLHDQFDDIAPTHQPVLVSLCAPFRHTGSAYVRVGAAQGGQICRKWQRRFHFRRQPAEVEFERLDLSFRIIWSLRFWRKPTLSHPGSCHGLRQAIAQIVRLACVHPNLECA